MAERSPDEQPQAPNSDTGKVEPQINWGAVLLGATVLALGVAFLQDMIVRVLFAVIVFVGVFNLIKPAAPDPELENPVLDKLREPNTGLDRRKYGRLRAYTDRLLEHVRAMNRMAVDARQGKVSHRHASAELDRLAEMMRGVISEIRKAAGVPTPVTELESLASKRPQPQVIMPKSRRETGEGAEEEAPVGADAEEAEETRETALAVESSDGDEDEEKKEGIAGKEEEEEREEE